VLSNYPVFQYAFSMDLGNIFRAYDVRGIYPSEINEAVAQRIAQAGAQFLNAKTMAVGRDVRLSSPRLEKAVIDGLISAGVDVMEIGAVPTELLYFAVGYYNLGGGIQVTASHNPAQFNGLKFIGEGVKALSEEDGLQEIRHFADSDRRFDAERDGEVHSRNVEEAYFDFLTQFCSFDNGRKLKIVANNNFGLSGPVVERLLKRLASDHIQLIKLNFEPNGTFPDGPPNPLLEKVQRQTRVQLLEHQADFAVMWDADGDRCMLMDERGEVIENCHLTALLAVYLLKENPGSKIIHDPRNVWAVDEAVKSSGGVPLVNRAGHAFIKHRMREEGALFAGETSGHFYFRDFFFADSGIIPFLLFLNIVANSDQKVSELFAHLRAKYPVSGEINFEFEDNYKVVEEARKRYIKGEIDNTDGLSVSYKNWRFNLHVANTENRLRLNVEAHDKWTLQAKTDELVTLIKSLSA